MYGVLDVRSRHLHPIGMRTNGQYRVRKLLGELHGLHRRGHLYCLLQWLYAQCRRMFS